MMFWVPLLACPAVFSDLGTAGQASSGTRSESVITFENHSTALTGDDHNRIHQRPICLFKYRGSWDGIRHPAGETIGAAE